jgi:hypothetical protein
MSKQVQVNTGDRYGRLVVLRETAREGQFRRFDVHCDCGALTNVRLNGMRTGNTRSCGCIVRELTALVNRTHGMSGTRTYRLWKAMITRATNPNTESAQHYVLRGITVCKRWMKFENFLADMGKCPEGLTLDRIDNDQGYKPGNCRWATRLEQARNKEREGHKHKGVNRLPSGNWRVNICTPTNRNLHVGVCATYEDAVALRKSAEAAYWGEPT